MSEIKLPSWMPPNASEAIRGNYIREENGRDVWCDCPWDEDGALVAKLCTSTNMQAAWQALACYPSARISSFVYWTIQLVAQALNWHDRENPERFLQSPGPVLSAQRIRAIRRAAEELLKTLGGEPPISDAILQQLGLEQDEARRVFKAVLSVRNATFGRESDAKILKTGIGKTADDEAPNWLAQQMKALNVELFDNHLNKVIAAVVATFVDAKYNEERAKDTVSAPLQDPPRPRLA